MAAVGIIRYCMRHPIRILFILLLLLLVIASRLLFSSIPEEKHVHELNLMTGTLSQQHGRKSDAKTKTIIRPGNVEKNTLEETKASQIEQTKGTLRGRNREKDLSSETREEKSRTNEVKVRHGIDKKNDTNEGKSKGNGKPKATHGSSSQENNILMVLAKVGQTSPLAQRFKRCLLSICERCTVSLSFHVLTDKVGKLTCKDAFSQAGKVCKNGLNVTYYDVTKVTEKVRPIVNDIQNLFRSGDPKSYYNHPLFFVSTAIHLILPQSMRRIIWLDSDLFFQADIKELFAEFDKFKPAMLFGLAREQQPVYRHVFHMFRNQNPGTKVGGEPPNGLTGFNSGVILFKLRNMRESKLYNELLRGGEVKNLAKKYTFQGHLGDQDFYSLLSMKYPELFHVLPCSWNRQLCTYWRDNGYAEVFDSYFNCSEPIHVYHGNCATKMPNE